MAQKKKIKVTVLMDLVLYDIENETFLRGRTVQNNENYKEVASMFASKDAENQDKILRSVKRAFAEVQSAVSEYLDESETETDNMYLEPDENLILNLEMPSNFNEAATKGIGEAVHDYITKTAIADWYQVTNKADAQEYEAMAQKSLSGLRQAVSKRARPQRPLYKRPVTSPEDPLNPPSEEEESSLGSDNDENSAIDGND